MTLNAGGEPLKNRKTTKKRVGRGKYHRKTHCRKWKAPTWTCSGSKLASAAEFKDIVVRVHVGGGGDVSFYASGLRRKEGPIPHRVRRLK